MAHLGSAVPLTAGFVVVTHPTGHPEAGFAASIKNLSMGLASRGGKMAMHDGGQPQFVSERCTACGLCARWVPGGRGRGGVGCPASAGALHRLRAVSRRLPGGRGRIRVEAGRAGVPGAPRRVQPGRAVRGGGPPAVPERDPALPGQLRLRRIPAEGRLPGRRHRRVAGSGGRGRRHGGSADPRDGAGLGHQVGERDYRAMLRTANSSGWEAWTTS